MKEEFLHFIFKKRLWLDYPIVLSDGRYAEVLDVGSHNHDSGPDFFNAKVKIGDEVWVGNVEIHINSSDWYKHGHQNDKAYGNVILHVVFNNDKTVFLPSGEEIPVWEMNFPHVLFNKFEEIYASDNEIPCSDYRDLIQKEMFNIWIEKMGVERLQNKSEFITALLEKSSNDWEHAFYISLARSFGVGINADAFEMLALSIPLKLLRKYSSNLFQLEALLFGQSGLILDAKLDDYVMRLSTEYEFLRKKHGLNPINPLIWRFSKMRPANQPYLKIAQFASLMMSFEGLFSKVVVKADANDIKSIIKINVSDYWKKHYSFGKIVEKTMSGFGAEAVNTLVINTIAPFIFVYQKHNSQNIDNLVEYSFLSNLKPENNREVRAWRLFGVKPQNAFESQALYDLKKEYCNKKECLRCNIGQSIMQQINNL